jgi:hypothetical protein
MQPKSKRPPHLLFSLAAFLTVSLCGCAKENQNTVEGQIPCPGAQYSAVIYHRAADKLLPETENVSIVRYGQPVLNEIGNVYCANREDTRSPQMLWLNWRTPNSLQIFRNPKTHSYKEDKHFECMTGVFIQTAPFDIEYGDYNDIKPGSIADDKQTKKPDAKPQRRGAHGGAKHR